MMTIPQLRAARAVLGIDRRNLVELSNVSLPTMQRMEASGANFQGNVDTLSKVVTAMESAGVELIGDYSGSDGDGHGVRLRQAPAHLTIKRRHALKFRESHTVPANVASQPLQSISDA